MCDERRRLGGALASWIVIACALACVGSGASPPPSEAGELPPAEPSEPSDGADRLEQLDVASVEDALVVLTVRSELSPYESVRFELKTRGRTLITSLSKTLVGGYDELADVGLLPRDELERVVDELVRCGIDSLPPSSGLVDPNLTYELEVRLDGFERLSSWAGVATAPGSAEWCVVRLIADTYFAHGDPVPFRNRFWDEGEYGELNVDSIPAARLFVDGRDTGLSTPVFGFRLAPGVHDLRFVNDVAAIDRTYDVTIEVGLTTQLEVELR